MKDIYPEYFVSSKEYQDELWKDPILVFDANVLLDLYRFPSNTTQEFLDLLKVLQNRIWMPYNIGLEFLRNRKSAIQDSIANYDRQKKFLERYKFKKEMLNNTQQNGNIRPKTAVFDANKLAEVLGPIITEQIQIVEEEAKKFKQILKTDHILESIQSIFEGKIQENPYTAEYIEKIKTLGEKRYANNVPPGYSDIHKEEIEIFPDFIIDKKFGDLLNWIAIVDKAVDSNKDVIFISNDEKPDWMEGDKENTKTPRKELLREFIAKTNGRKFFIYNTDNFLKLAKIYFKVSVSKNNMEVIQELSKPEQHHDLYEHLTSTLPIPPKGDNLFNVDSIAIAHVFQLQHQYASWNIGYTGDELDYVRFSAIRHLLNKGFINTHTQMKAVDSYWTVLSNGSMSAFMIITDRFTPTLQGVYDLVNESSRVMSDYECSHAFIFLDVTHKNFDPNIIRYGYSIKVLSGKIVVHLMKQSATDKKDYVLVDIFLL